MWLANLIRRRWHRSGTDTCQCSTCIDYRAYRAMRQALMGNSKFPVSAEDVPDYPDSYITPAEAAAYHQASGDAVPSMLAPGETVLTLTSASGLVAFEFACTGSSSIQRMPHAVLRDRRGWEIPVRIATNEDEHTLRTPSGELIRFVRTTERNEDGHIVFGEVDPPPGPVAPTKTTRAIRLGEE